MYLVLCMYLLSCSLFDIKYRKIPSLLLYIGLFCSIVFALRGVLVDNLEWSQRLLAFIPGIVMLIYSKISKEKIGYGDGLLALAIACIVPFRKLYIIIILSFCCAFIFALMLLLINKENIKREFPFSPFLLGSCGLVLFVLT